MHAVLGALLFPLLIRQVDSDGGVDPAISSIHEQLRVGTILGLLIMSKQTIQKRQFDTKSHGIVKACSIRTVRKEHNLFLPIKNARFGPSPIDRGCLGHA